MHAAFLSRRPVAPLDRFIDTVCTSQPAAGLPHAREWGLPTGCADLVIPLDGHRLWRCRSADDARGRSFSVGVLQGAQDQAALRDTSRASLVDLHRPLPRRLWPRAEAACDRDALPGVAERRACGLRVTPPLARTTEHLFKTAPRASA